MSVFGSVCTILNYCMSMSASVTAISIIMITVSAPCPRTRANKGVRWLVNRTLLYAWNFSSKANYLCLQSLSIRYQIYLHDFRHCKHIWFQSTVWNIKSYPSKLHKLILNSFLSFSAGVKFSIWRNRGSKSMKSHMQIINMEFLYLQRQ